MELLYVYAKEFRLFKNQEFRFSDRFLVDYDPDTRDLRIRPNPDYFDIYPGNIRNISAIVGRNAAGKTSLLSLIGASQLDRASNKGSYFLVSYLGEDRGTARFLLESNHPEDYFQGMERHYGDELCPTVLDLTADGLRFHEPGDSLPPFDHRFISFAPGNKKDLIAFSPDISRCSARMQTASIYDRIKFLTDSIRLGNSDHALYRSDHYEVQLSFQSDPFLLSLPAASDHDRIAVNRIKQYLRNLQKYIPEAVHNTAGWIKDKKELCLMAILRVYIIHMLSELMPSIPAHPGFYKKWHIHPNGTMGSVQGIKDELIRIAEILYNDCSPAPVSSSMAFQIRFLERLLEHADIFIPPLPHIQKQENSFQVHILWTVTGSSLSSEGFSPEELAARRDCLNFLQKMLEKDASLSWEIRYLSQGEQENLAMFASIHEQVSLREEEELAGLPEAASDSPAFQGRKHFVLLFDEIERSMHPNMCRCLIDDLTKFLSRYRDREFQIIIATHSPFLLGDLRKQNVICLEGDGKVRKRKDQQESFGQNIHSLLKDQFFLDNTFSEYAVGMIALITDCLRMQSLEEMRIAIHKKLGDGFRGKCLPRNDAETRQFLSSLIGSVGEPLIRRSLEEQLLTWNQRPPLDRQARLEWYRRKTRELEAELQKEEQP